MLEKLISLEDNKENNDGKKSQGQYFYSRSQVGVSEKCFDWKRNCFICGKVCDTKHGSGWSIVECCTNSKENMYKKVLHAAEKKKRWSYANEIEFCYKEYE